MVVPDQEAAVVEILSRPVGKSVVQPLDQFLLVTEGKDAVALSADLGGTVVGQLGGIDDIQLEFAAAIGFQAARPAHDLDVPRPRTVAGFAGDAELRHLGVHVVLSRYPGRPKVVWHCRQAWFQRPG